MFADLESAARSPSSLLDHPDRYQALAQELKNTLELIAGLGTRALGFLRLYSSRGVMGHELWASSDYIHPEVSRDTSSGRRWLAECVVAKVAGWSNKGDGMDLCSECVVA